MRRTLGGDVKDRQALDLVAEEVQTKRLVALGRPHVDDAAAHGDLRAMLDQVLAAIAHVHEPRNELVALHLGPASKTYGARSGSGESSWAMERAEATTTRGARPSRSRQRSSERIAITWLSGLTRSRGWVSQPGHCATSLSPSQALRASVTCSASLEVAVTAMTSSLSRASDARASGVA